jgi:DNA-binding HxlR family transcriptional regulator
MATTTAAQRREQAKRDYDATVTASVPVRVDYALTPLGQELFPVMIAIKDWAETHMDRVFEARAHFDARP